MYYVKMSEPVIPNIHTICMHRPLTFDMYQSVCDILFDKETKKKLKEKLRWYDKNHGYTLRSKYDRTVSSSIFCPYGISNITLITSKDSNGYFHNQMFIEMNLNDMLGEKDRLETFENTPENIKKVIEVFHLCFSVFPEGMNKIDDYFLLRVDFCIDLFLPETLKKDYLSLFRRCGLPYGFELETYKDEKAKKNKVPKERIAASGNCICVVAYDKLHQLEACRIKGYDADKAKEMLRLEVQLCALKLKPYVLFESDDKFFDVSFKNAFENLRKHACEVFYSNINKVFGEGLYVSMDIARDVIAESSYKQKTKDKMTELVMLTASHRSLNDAMEEFMLGKGMKRKKVTELLKKFKPLGINPITIPSRWGYDTMPDIEGLIGQAHIYNPG